jgi:endonuclease I
MKPSQAMGCGVHETVPEDGNKNSLRNNEKYFHANGTTY